MTTDLVTRLRERAKGREHGYDGSYMLEAADEIERLKLAWDSSFAQAIQNGATAKVQTERAELAEQMLAEANREIGRINDARLTWAMACHCECAACSTFYDVVRERDPIEGAMLDAACGKYAPETKAAQPGAWLIWYEDHVVYPEIFVGEGAEEAAQRRFAQARDHWSCHLFQRIGDSTAPKTSPEPELRSPERHALWVTLEYTRTNPGLDPTARKLLRELYERTAPDVKGDA